jgi:hypothetical protein
VLALSSYGDPLGPYDFHSALFGPSKEKAFPFHGPVRMVVADPIQACDVKAFKVVACWLWGEWVCVERRSRTRCIGIELMNLLSL